MGGDSKQTVFVKWKGDSVSRQVRKGIERILESGTQEIAVGARSRAPRDTGKYAASIRTKKQSFLTSKFRQEARAFRVVFGKKVGSIFGKRLALAAILEYGTKTGEGENTKARMKRHPHVFIAYKSARLRMRSKIQGLFG